MKRKVQRRLRAATMFMLPVLSLSAQDKVEADIGAELVSDYVWRGQDLGNISVQPTASISYKGLWLSGWGTLGFDKDDTKEFDLTLGYGIKGFSISVTDYWFGDGAGYFHYDATNTSHVFEAQVGYDFDILAVNWFTNFAGCDGVNKQGKRGLFLLLLGYGSLQTGRIRLGVRSGSRALGNEFLQSIGRRRLWSQRI